MNRLDFQIDDLMVYGRPEGHRDSWGLFFRPDGLRGWDDGVTVRREALAIPSQHGEFDLPVLRGSRVLSISAYAFERSSLELGKQRSRIMGVGAAGQLIRLSAEHQGEMLTASGRLHATPEFRDRGSNREPYIAEWDLQIVCPDPRKYGATISTREGEVAVNRGNFPAIPTIYATRVSGSGGYTVSAGGRQIVVSAALAVGAKHRIDIRTGGIYSGATRLVGAISTYRPWSVPAGGALEHSASAGIRLDVETTDTFI